MVPLVATRLLHAGPQATPVPHWVVLLVAVPSLWVLVGGGVLLADRLLRRVGV